MNELEAIRKLIANNQTDIALERLMKVASEDYINDVILINSRYSNFKDAEIKGIEEKVELNRINNSLLELLDKPNLIAPEAVRLERELLPRLEEKLEALVRARMNELLPVGAIIPFAGAKIPDGWLLCDGNELDIDKYRTLYNVLSVWNTHNEKKPKHNHFFIPDLRGQFIRGARNAEYGVGIREDDATALPKNDFAFSVSSNGEHAHLSNHKLLPWDFPGWKRNTGNQQAHDHVVQTNPQDHIVQINTQDAGIHFHTVTLTGGGDEETRPKNYAVNFIIKAK